MKAPDEEAPLNEQAVLAHRAAPAAAVAAGGPEVSVVAPTFNERGNVARLVEKLDATLAGVAWEVIFVDDNSPDGTAAAARAIGEGDSRVLCIRSALGISLSARC